MGADTRVEQPGKVEAVVKWLNTQIKIWLLNTQSAKLYVNSEYVIKSNVKYDLTQ